MAGVGLMIAIMPLNTVLMNKMRFLQLRQMKLKDERLKMSTEILNGIKVCRAGIILLIFIAQKERIT